MPHTQLTGSIPYSPSEAMTLRGSNSLSAKDAFYERKKYKDLPLFLDLPRPLHSWYTSYYYGRVDSIQNGIALKPLGPIEWATRQTAKGVTTYEPARRNTLKQVKSKAGNVFALNFVADAFEDLRAHMERAGQGGFINTENTVYYKLEPTAGWENYEVAFRELNRTYGRRYTTWINSKKSKAAKVLNFSAFVKELLNYMGSGKNDLPLTLTGYVVSNHSSPMISGLSLELKEKPNYANDMPKFNTYILDPNFQYFVKAARKYGFYVDRNGPWKITADPLSLPMLGKMTKSYAPDCEQIGGYFDSEQGQEIAAPTVQQFFSTYYYKTYKQDLQKLKLTLLKMYNKFAKEYPRIVVESGATVRCPNREVRQIKRRAPTSFEEIDKLGDLYWLHLYFNIRTREAKIKCTDYDQKLRMINDMYKAYDVDTAMRYINNTIKPYLYNLQVGKKVLTKKKGSVTIGSVTDSRGAPSHVGPAGTSRGGSY